MGSKIDDILSEVLKRTTPTREEKRSMLALIERLKRKIEKAAKQAKLDIIIRVEGSVAKNTWLRETPEVDVFMQVPSTESREALGTTYLGIARKATEDAEQIERFAEHPFLEVVLDSVRVNVVPCYCVKKGEWQSATDRTPFHTDYVKPLLNERLCGEVRILKKFMKGINCYGAEIKIGGFSGYLCELLVLFYASFINVLKAASEWRQAFIDLEAFYQGREDKAKLVFKDPLIIVDPVDRGRNAASAVRRERLGEFISASRAFLDEPDINFFYPPETKPYGSERLLKMIRRRGSSLIFIKFGKSNAVPDIWWGQLYKSQKFLRRVVKQHDFSLIRDGVWSNEHNLSLFVFEVTHRSLPSFKTHLGPPLDKRDECRRFLQKHLDSVHTISGPRIEGGRWIVETKRKYVDLIDLLRDKIKKKGNQSALGKHVAKAISKSLEILDNEEILPMYSYNRKFAEFLTDYLNGKPKWLIKRRQ
ncbi:MAG: CCA tRNA nucleotidyltransferase [Candidatus Bathyarchaeota archaeon]|nr:MAG: CCA tRNA nucleotidyltransferase [Candidatus Bathyarchaeota archaeon]